MLFPNPVLVFALEMHDMKSDEKLLLPQQAGQKVMITFFVVDLHFTQLLVQLSVNARAGFADMLW